MSKVKHVWDPALKDFVPELKKERQLSRVKSWVINWIVDIKYWPEVRKFAAVGFILRLIQLGKAAFWYDEGVTVVLSRLPWSQMIEGTAGDVHPPGYYIIIWLLGQTGIPITQFTARMPSAVLSVIAIYLTWSLAERLDLSRIAKYAILVWVIISPLQLHYAQEARMYGLLQVEVLAAFIFILDNKKALLSVALAAILYTHNYAVFYLPTFALAAVMNDIGSASIWVRAVEDKPIEKLKVYIYFIARAFMEKWGIYFLIPLLLWVPWFLVLLSQMGMVSAGYWIQPVTVPSVVFVLYQMLFAYSMPPPFQGLGVLLTMGLLFYTGWRLNRDRPKHYQILLVMAFTPLLLSVIISLAWRPVLLFRGLIGSSIPLIMLIAVAFEGIKIPYKKIYAASLVLVTLVAGLYGHYAYNVNNKGATTEWVRRIEGKYEQGDVILSLNDNGVIAVLTYGTNLPMYKLTSCGEEPLGALGEITRSAIGVKERRLNQLIPSAEYTRVWFISTVAPISPACEIAAANKLINMPTARLIESLQDDEYTQAGIYLITPEDTY